MQLREGTIVSGRAVNSRNADLIINKLTLTIELFAFLYFLVVLVYQTKIILECI